MRVRKNGKSSYELTDWHVKGLHTRSFCIFDLEATGGDTHKARITQIGAVKVSGGEVICGSEWSQLVNPQEPIRPFITELTGISDDHVKDAPEFKIAFQRFIEQGEDSVWVSHSAFEFDIPLLLAECKRCSLDFPKVDIMDNRALHTFLHPEKEGVFGTHYQLEYFGIEIGNRQRHNALGDALLAADIFCANLALLGKQNLEDISLNAPMTVQYGHLPEAAARLEWEL